MGGIVAMTYAMVYGQRLRAPMLNDVGPEVEQARQRILVTVGGRAKFASLEDAMAREGQHLAITVITCAGRSAPRAPDRSLR
jgi:hypothetical protein